MKRISPIAALSIGLALFSGAISYAAKTDQQKTNLNASIYSRQWRPSGVLLRQPRWRGLP